MPFALDSNPTPSEISEAINYLLGNATQSLSVNSGNGQVSDPAGGLVSYLYKYIHVKYSDSFDGTFNFSNTPTNRFYFGLRNTDDPTESSVPQDYVWYQVTGGFGVNKYLYYTTTGGRQAQFQVSTSTPSSSWLKDDGTAIDLDIITAAAAVANFVIYRTANNSTAPTEAETFNQIGRKAIANDIATINYNAGANSIQYQYDGAAWNVLNRYITGDIIKNLIGIDTPISTVQYEDFNTNLSAPAYSNGRMYYNKDKFALCYYNEANGFDINIGREIDVRVYNNTGSTLNAGQMVYVSSAASGWPIVSLAQANTEATSQSVLGMVAKSIANGAYGYVCISGVAHNIDTSAYAPGTLLYLSAAAAGAVTGTPPIQPNFVVNVGIVLDQNAVSGRVLVQISSKPWFPNFEGRNTTATTNLPTTPTVFALPTVVKSDGISYDTGTGIFTVNRSINFAVMLQLNCTPSASGKNVYFYAEVDEGSGWVIQQYTARQQTITNNAAIQLPFYIGRYFAAGTKIRFYVWADATVSIKTTDLPGTTAGTVTLPAALLTMS